MQLQSSLLFQLSYKTLYSQWVYKVVSAKKLNSLFKINKQNNRVMENGKGCFVFLMIIF